MLASMTGQLIYQSVENLHVFPRCTIVIDDKPASSMSSATSWAVHNEVSIFYLYNRCRVLGQTSIGGADDDASFSFPLQRIFVLDGVHDCPLESFLP